MAHAVGFSRDWSRRIFRFREKFVDWHSGWSGLLSMAAVADHDTKLAADALFGYQLGLDQGP